MIFEMKLYKTVGNDAWRFNRFRVKVENHFLDGDFQMEFRLMVHQEGLFDCWWILLPRRSRRILIEGSEGEGLDGFEEVIDRSIHPIDSQWNEKLLYAEIATFWSIHPTLATINPFATSRTTDIPLKCHSLCQFHWRTRKIHCLCFFTFKSTRLEIIILAHENIVLSVEKTFEKPHQYTDINTHTHRRASNQPLDYEY